MWRDRDWTWYRRRIKYAHIAVTVRKTIIYCGRRDIITGELQPFCNGGAGCVSILICSNAIYSGICYCLWPTTSGKGIWGTFPIHTYVDYNLFLLSTVQKTHLIEVRHKMKTENNNKNRKPYLEYEMSFFTLKYCVS